MLKNHTKKITWVPKHDQKFFSSSSSILSSETGTGRNIEPVKQWFNAVRFSLAQCSLLPCIAMNWSTVSAVNYIREQCTAVQ